MHNINIFELPHLLENICQHLTLTEIRQCCRVSKDWQSFFRSQDGCKVILSSDFVFTSDPFHYSRILHHLYIPHYHQRYYQYPRSRNNNHFKYYFYCSDPIIMRNYNFEQQQLQHQDEILEYADRIRSLKLESGGCQGDLHQNRIQFLIRSRCRGLKDLTVCIESRDRFIRNDWGMLPEDDVEPWTPPELVSEPDPGPPTAFQGECRLLQLLLRQQIRGSLTQLDLTIRFRYNGWAGDTPVKNFKHLIQVLTPLFPSSSIDDDDDNNNDDRPLRNLKCLRLGYFQPPVWHSSLPISPCVLQDLLQNLPPGLLDFEWKGRIRSILRDAAGQQLQHEQQEGNNQKRLRPLKLRRLCLSECDFTGAEVSVLIPLIRSCVHLEEIHLPAVEKRLARTVIGSLIESCPKLCSFEFGSERFWTGTWTSSPVVMLLQAYISSIREIVLVHGSLQIMNDLFVVSRLTPSTHRSSLPVPLESPTLNTPGSFARLEKLVVTYPNYLTSQHFLPIVESCPELKVLQFKASNIDRPRDQGLWLSDLISNTANWICDRLEVLEIPIRDNLFLARNWTQLGRRERQAENKKWRAKFQALVQFHDRRLSRLSSSLKDLRLHWNQEGEWKHVMVQQHDRGNSQEQDHRIHPEYCSKNRCWDEKTVEWDLPGSAARVPPFESRTPWYLNAHRLSRDRVEEIMFGFPWLTRYQLQWMGLLHHWPLAHQVRIKTLTDEQARSSSNPTVRVHYADEQSSLSPTNARLGSYPQRCYRAVAFSVVMDLFWTDKDYREDATDARLNGDEPARSELREDEEYDYDFVHGFWKDAHDGDGQGPAWISSWKKYKRFGAIHHRKSFQSRFAIKGRMEIKGNK